MNVTESVGELTHEEEFNNCVFDEEKLELYKKACAKLKSMELKDAYLSALAAFNDEGQGLTKKRDIHDIGKRTIGDLAMNGLNIGGKIPKNKDLLLDCLKAQPQFWVKYHHIARRLIEEHKAKAAQDIQKEIFQ
eukprot:15136536-Ditylum_brightwellii.AAC.1